MTDPLSCPLIDRRGQDKDALAKRLAAEIWRLASQPREAHFYVEYYDAKIDLLNLGQISPLTHSDVIAIANYVKNERAQTLETLRKQLFDIRPAPSWLKSGSLDSADYAIRFGASLWLLVDTSDWKEAESLSEFVERGAASLAKRPLQTALGPVLHFNARMLNRIAGVDLIWTSNVMEHLRLDLEDPKAPQLFVFRHASFLSRRGSAGEAGS
jgi:hypothetical protein